MGIGGKEEGRVEGEGRIREEGRDGRMEVKGRNGREIGKTRE